MDRKRVWKPIRQQHSQYLTGSREPKSEQTIRSSSASHQVIGLLFWNTASILTVSPMLGVETLLDLVYDTDRIMFLRSYLTQLQRATSEGVSGARAMFAAIRRASSWVSSLAAARRPGSSWK
jgi:hypothetical protein